MSKRVVYDYAGKLPEGLSRADVIDGSEELLSAATRAEQHVDDPALRGLFAGPLPQGDIEID